MGTIDFIPRKDAEFRDWARNFVRRITDTPGVYGLVQADADSLNVVYERFDAAYRITSSPDTRTQPAITAKQEARWTLENLIRAYARDIKANLGVTDGDKIALGVPPINATRSKRKVPHVSPELNILGQTPGVDHLRVTQSTSNSSAKPYGAERLEVFIAYTEAGDPPPTKEDAKYLRSFRKKNIKIEHDPAMGEKRATYWARWAGFNDDVGPWSLPVSMSSATQAKQKKEAEAKQNAQQTSEQSSMKRAA